MKKIAIPTLTTLALLLASCGGNPQASSPPVLRVASSGNSVGAALGAPESSSDRMMWIGRQHFTVSGDLPSLDSAAPSYVISETDVTKRELNSLREVFSIKDEFVVQDANMGGGYIAGDYNNNTGETPVMYVSADAMRYWSYQAPWSSMPSIGCAMPSVEPGDTVSSVEPCATPAPPENVPSGEEAERMFKQMLKDLGLKSKDFIIEIYADEWSASASGYLKIDGVRSPLMWSASYGADSKLTFASGVLAKITPGADYPRIGTAQGIGRLNDQQYGWGGPMMRGGVAYNDMAVWSSDATSDSTTSETNVGEPVSTEPEILEGTVDSTIEDQEIPITEIEIVAVEEELVSLYGADGSIYLVPGYSFLAAKEAGYTPRFLVSALPDEFIEETNVDSVSTTPADVSGVPAPAPIDPSNPVTDEPNITQEAADTLLTLSERAATEMAVSNGWEVRVGQRDDEMFMLTKDWIATRVTLTIVDGTVTQVDVG